MINSLPKSLVETATNQLQEAVALKSHIDMANKASRSTKVNGITRAEHISAHVIPHGSDSVTIPLERDTVPAHPEIEKHLESVGYDVHDYKKGLAIKKGQSKNPVSIGKVLERTNAPSSVKETYQKDPNRQGIDSDVSIVVSRKPTHVAGMSTHQNWESCQTLGGGGKDENGKELFRQQPGQERQHVKEDIAAGSHIAYLVHKPEDVDKHYAPIARTVLKPYTSESGHTILRPMKTYGDEWGGFHSSVHKWAEKHFPTKDAEYTMHSDVYPDGAGHIRDYSEHHNAYWMGKNPTHSSNWDLLLSQPQPKVISHYLDQITAHDKPSMFLNMMAKNPHLTDEHVNRIINHPKSGIDVKENLVAVHKAAVPHGIANPELHVGVSENPHLSEGHIQHLLDTYHSLFADDKPFKTTSQGRLFSNLARHPNLSTQQANHIASFDRTSDHPSVVEGVFKNADDNHVNSIIEKLNESGNFNSMSYYGRAFSAIASHKPHLIPRMSNIMLLHGYNETKSDSPAHQTLEEHMLSRGDVFHKILASRSDNQKILSSLHAATNDPDVKSRVATKLVGK